MRDSRLMPLYQTTRFQQLRRTQANVRLTQFSMVGETAVS